MQLSAAECSGRRGRSKPRFGAEVGFRYPQFDAPSKWRKILLSAGAAVSAGA
jgi:hypothetical protein